jgi:hypothetical protein
MVADISVSLSLTLYLAFVLRAAIATASQPRAACYKPLPPYTMLGLSLIIVFSSPPLPLPCLSLLFATPHPLRLLTPHQLRRQRLATCFELQHVHRVEQHLPYSNNIVS